MKDVEIQLEKQKALLNHSSGAWCVATLEKSVANIASW